MMSYNNKFRKNLLEQISSLSSTEHGEIFKMIRTHEVNFTQNKNGVFFNLSVLDDTLIEEIHNFVSYCVSNKKQLDEYECKLNECKLNNNFDTILNIPLDKMEKFEQNPVQKEDWSCLNNLQSSKTQRLVNFIEKMSLDKEKVVKKKANVKFCNARKKYAKRTVVDKKLEELDCELLPDTPLVC